MLFFSSLTIKENTGEMFPIRHRYRFQPTVLSRVAYLRYVWPMSRNSSHQLLPFSRYFVQMFTERHTRTNAWKFGFTLWEPQKRVWAEIHSIPYFYDKESKRDNERIIKRSRNQRLKMYKMYKMQFYRI